MAKKKTCAAPGGLAISRSGGTYVFSWNQGEKYKVQDFQFRVNWGGWIPVGVSKGQTSVSLSLGGYVHIGFIVRGKSNKNSKWSGWAEGNYFLEAPYGPSASAELQTPTKTKFTYSVPVDEGSTHNFDHAEWQSVLIENCNTNDGNAVNWNLAESGTGGSSMEWIKEEQGFSASDDSYSFTRWFRVRAHGWAGATGWAYAKHIYATPERAKNVTASCTKLTSIGYAVKVDWDSPTSVARPIDSVTVNYTETVPHCTVAKEGFAQVAEPEGNPSEKGYYELVSGEYVLTTDTEVASGKTYYLPSSIKMTLDCPTTGVNWTSLNAVGGIGGKRTQSFSIGSDITDDTCIFTRVDNKHDDNTTEGVPVLALGGLGKIAKPAVALMTNLGGKLWRIQVDRNTAIDEAFIAIYFRTESDPNLNAIIGIVPAGRSSVDCILPDWVEGEGISVGVKAYVANYSPAGPTSDTRPTYYSITDIPGIGMMESELNWDGGEVPLPPSNVTVTKVNDSVVQVGWGWSWRDATQAELSWADHEDAWESTDEPQTYVVSATNVGRWNIAGLGIGTWYIRVRLIKTEGETTIYGTYCEPQIIKLSSSPDTPALVLSEGVIAADADVTCYWAYVSTDGTAQMQAEVCEAFYSYEEVTNPTGSPLDNGWYELINDKYTRSFDIVVETGKTYYKTTGTITYGDPIASTVTAQHITLHAADFGWLEGETHNLAVRVMSASGESSEGWSAPVPVTIANAITAEITSHSFEEKQIPIENEEGIESYRTVLSLTEFPIELTATGAGVGGSTTYIIERATSFHMMRPDGTEHEGFEGETIVIKNQNGELPVTITADDLIGAFDDGASYRVIAIAKDSYGQTAETSLLLTGSYEAVSDPIGSPKDNGWYELVSEEYVLSDDTEVDPEKTYYKKKVVDSFEVHWDHQALVPTATIELDPDHLATFITPIAPNGWEEGDVVDIYRLSVDPPELIISGGEFGTTYVDPYPTLGKFGGHRVVYRTVNCDYITEDNVPAWTDYEADDNPAYMHNTFGVVIDFSGEQMTLPYNVTLSNSWKKDFSVTRYLGGSIQGDWNPGVDKTASSTAVIPIEEDGEMVTALRRLAVYPGVCHVRTPDGSSYTANIDVKDDREAKWVKRLSKVSLDITRVDAEGFDGMTKAQWDAQNAEDE